MIGGPTKGHVSPWFLFQLNAFFMFRRTRAMLTNPSELLPPILDFTLWLIPENNHRFLLRVVRQILHDKSVEWDSDQRNRKKL